MAVETYFPRLNAVSDPATQPLQPTISAELTPIYDVEGSKQPLAKFNDDYSQIYPEYQHHDRLTPPEIPPQLRASSYLYPVLTRNEYLRLTMLWYYTRDLVEDQDLLDRLQVKVNLLKDFIGWDIAILGLLENHAYRRVVTSGIGLARLPRRESPCSHIVHGTRPGDVFVVPDMEADWRFKGSPHVCYGGIRSYAGTTLRCQVADGEAVALGSLCLASETPGRSLNKSQTDALVRFSDMIVSDIVNAQRLSRRDVQQRMSDSVAKATSHSAIDDVEADIMSILVQSYPLAHVGVCDVHAQSIQLENGRFIPLSQTKQGLWEDSAFIDELIATRNHQELKADQTVRAVIGRFWSHPTLKVLVVRTTEVTQVFDDIDAWFVDRCSAVLSNIAQERSLKEARQAKEQFLRGITHQLRTPIHGVLGSVDILAEELAARDLLKDKTSADTAATAEELVSNIAERASQQQHGKVNTADVLRTIQNSGRELMSTVNNMIKLNRWAEVVDTQYIPTVNDLSKLEDMLLEETTRMLPDNEVERLCIFFDNQLPENANAAMIDVNLVKECLHSILLNAFQYTTMGCVIVSAAMSEDDHDLIFEVKDTGRGIQAENSARIFEAYEKEDAHGRGAGLGLTLAAKMASAMNGSVELIKSAPNVGSTFRVTFRDAGIACRVGTVPCMTASARVKITRFSTVPGEPMTYTVQHFIKFLQRRGLELSEHGEDNLMIVSYIPIAEKFKEYLNAANDFKGTAVCLMPASENIQHYQREHPHISFLTGPFTSKRMDEIMDYLENLYAQRQTLNPPTSTLGVDDGEPQRSLSAAVISIQELHLGPSRPLVKRARSRVVPQVLLVDDNLINLRIIRMYCDKRHLPYKTATDGLIAINAYKQALQDGRPIGLILLDLQMPNCDGIEACVEIRRIEKDRGLSGAVVFIITGQDSPKDRERAFDAGADEFFVKPMSLKALDRGISQYFEPPS
ncbi:Response regulator receiver domain-containing protein 4 [Elsinoe fawcettii]|nr:Response regulator receiver domain-containing protein 4 [Elsinoe fawcettii]